ncbi:MAG: PRC and DUF2382 domain-containing protein [Nocardioidaceae bacterium]|nr:PRC and DUF2382 domain-containing protein [Nocardioidaceae bacterium]MDQ3325428.1 PRC and DUF2382 domain-containing protein [Actinomycetota bacterium]
MDLDNVQQMVGSTAYGSDGDKIGKVGQVYLDDASGEPDWATVNTGLFGTSETFVPLQGASFDNDRLNVAHSQEKVKDAPKVDLDGDHLPEAEERRLYEHYGIGFGGYSYDNDTTAATTTTTTTDTDRSSGADFTSGSDTSGPTTDDAMTRSEEQVSVGTAKKETGKARLRKYVTTENVTQTVPVRKEKAVLETEPVTDANVGTAGDGPAISEEEHDVTLSEEQVVVQKEAKPVERVRIGKEETVEEQTVNEEVRKEHIEADGDVDERGTAR